MAYTANTTIPNLDQATALNDSDLLVLSQSATTKRVSVSVLVDKALSAKTTVPSSTTQSTDTVIIRRGTISYDVVLSSLLPLSAIGSGQLASKAVTDAKLSSGATDTDRAVGTEHIKDRVVTGAKIALNAVAKENLATPSVGTPQLEANAVASANLSSGSVSTRAVATDVLQYNTYAGARGETRLLNPWGADTPLNWPAQGNQTSQTAENTTVRTVFNAVSSANNAYDWYLSCQECSPPFAGLTDAGAAGVADQDKGGAYAGGVLLPDGRVFLVPYNASPAVYDPAKDTLTAVAWPGGVAPMTTSYAAYSGGTLLAGPPATSGNYAGARAGSQTPLFTAGPVVVCAPFYAKKPLIYNPQTNTCTYGTNVTGLPNRAFGGIVPLGPTVTINSNRVALLVPNASGSLYLVDSAGNMAVTTGSTARSSGYGAALLSDMNVGFGTFTFALTAQTTTASTWSSTFTDYPVNISTATTNAIVTVSQSGYFCKNGSSSDYFAKTPASATGVYRVSGLVRLPDGYVMAVPGYWGSGVTPSVLIFSTSSSSASPSDAISLPLPLTLQQNTAVANVDHPGNGLFSGGVLLTDGRVFLVPCTSTKAYIISTRRPTMPVPEELVLGPYWNKR